MLVLLGSCSGAIIRHVNLCSLDVIWGPKKNYSLCWSILICSFPKRVESLYFIVNKLAKLIDLEQLADKIEILVFIDSGEFTTGYKRKILVQQSHGEYVSFIDDDDDVSDVYIQKIYECLRYKPDVVAIKGAQLVDNVLHHVFIQSIKFNRLHDPERFIWGYYCFKIKFSEPFSGKSLPLLNDTLPIKCHYVAHLNPIRRDIILHCQFEDYSLAEDVQQSIKLQTSGLLFKEKEVDEIVYLYKTHSITISSK